MTPHAFYRAYMDNVNRQDWDQTEYATKKWQRFFTPSML